MAGIPMHDEQGSRDRPYDLTVRFDPEGVARVLAAAGRRVWMGERPTLTVTVTVRRGALAYDLTADGHESERARETLMDACARFAMQAALPLARPDDPLSAAAPPDVPGAVPLTGTLAWDDATFGWTGAWSLRAGGREHRWRIKGASLDEASRDAVGGAMRVLSGNAPAE